jgi:hypothetical protein
VWCILLGIEGSALLTSAPPERNLTMKFNSANRTVLVKHSSTLFEFQYRKGFRATINISVECEQGFGGQPTYTGSVFVFANGSSADTYLNYTMSARNAEDLAMLLSIDAAPYNIAMTVWAQSAEYVHRDSGLPISETNGPVETAVWAAFRHEIDGLPTSKYLPLTGRAV